MRKVVHMAKKRRKFTSQYKTEVVKLIKDSGKSVSSISRELGLTESAVCTWVKQHDIDAGKGAPGALTTAEREELTRLRRENRQLQMEREILKKATAFFARESR
jgi:transposase